MHAWIMDFVVSKILIKVALEQFNSVVATNEFYDFNSHPLLYFPLIYAHPLS